MSASQRGISGRAAAVEEGGGEHWTPDERQCHAMRNARWESLGSVVMVFFCLGDGGTRGATVATVVEMGGQE